MILFQLPSRSGAVSATALTGSVGFVSGLVAGPSDSSAAKLTETSARQTLASACGAVCLDPVGEVPEAVRKLGGQFALIEVLEPIGVVFRISSLERASPWMLRRRRSPQPRRGGY
jgi:hypothetical protein